MFWGRWLWGKVFVGEGIVFFFGGVRYNGKFGSVVVECRGYLVCKLFGRMKSSYKYNVELKKLDKIINIIVWFIFYWLSKIEMLKLGW